MEGGHSTVSVRKLLDHRICSNGQLPTTTEIIFFKKIHLIHAQRCVSIVILSCIKSESGETFRIVITFLVVGFLFVYSHYAVWHCH